MSTKALVLSLVMITGGCASSERSEVADRGATSYDRPIAYERAPDSSSRAGEVAVGIVGTPFLLAFKTVVCAGSLVVAAPTAAVLTLAEGPKSEGIRILGDGIAKNCGPPYVVTPRGT